MLKGFKNFVMRGDIVAVAVGLVIALALSTLIKAFTDAVINPIIASLQGGRSMGMGWQLGRAGNQATYLDLGAFISAVIYFLIFMAVVYFFIVVPYKHVQARRGVVVFADPGPLRVCPDCLSEDLPAAARRCRYCGADERLS
ncbi:large conductance mechanosensitive channel protein MscL [Streptomyces griseocarneus]|uniref:large conductance mechanosensitive channel protein MscL n=1 Tax=Streptomyces griseocarneus TaxID=51201 RepID=UPI00167D39BA|nr:MscL family protein [Streptomyces griseocarneus]MBZ6475932.1 MscL family protein [Streptomyces griseocarneus]